MTALSSFRICDIWYYCLIANPNEKNDSKFNEFGMGKYYYILYKYSSYDKYLTFVNNSH